MARSKAQYMARTRDPKKAHFSNQVCFKETKRAGPKDCAVQMMRSKATKRAQTREPKEVHCSN